MSHLKPDRRRRIIPAAVACLVAGLVASVGALASEGEEQGSGRRTYVDSQRTWFFISFLEGDDDAETLGLELESRIGAGKYSVKNISYFEVADYPRPIPGQPPGNVQPGLEVDTGINDLLTAFWFVKEGEHHGKHHLSWGVAAQLPTATTDTLGSGKWCIGPSFDYEFQSGKLFAGFIALNLWSFAGDSDRKEVRYFMAKPFVVYNFAEKWDLLYMPYGITIYWDKPAGDNVYFPVGGGVQRHLGSSSNISVQAFKNVLRPDKGTRYDLRFMLEFVF